MNPWYEFLKCLIERDFRKSISGFATEFNFPSFPAIMNKLKNNPVKKITADTIGKIEKALNITIDDSDPSNIKWYNHTTRSLNSKDESISVNGDNNSLHHNSGEINKVTINKADNELKYELDMLALENKLLKEKITSLEEQILYHKKLIALHESKA